MKTGKKFDIDRVVFIGRSYDEYLKMFDLDKENLSGESVLDCPAGASSFTAESSNRRYDVLATDILYDINPDFLERKCEEDLSKTMKSMVGVEDLYIWNYFKGLDELRRHRMATYKRFIEDYRTEMGKKYIKSELPKLPFRDGEFSLVLSSHFLFLYDDRLSYEFHRDSIQEMFRVSSREVRIFPLVGFSGNRSLFVDRLIEDNLFRKNRIEIRKVLYGFVKNGNEMIVIRC